MLPICKLAVCCYLLFVTSTAMAYQRVKLETERDTLRGKSFTVLTHAPFRIGLFGLRFLIPKEEVQASAHLLGMSSEDLSRTISVSWTLIDGDIGIKREISGIEDPANAIAQELAKCLASDLEMEHMTSLVSEATSKLLIGKSDPHQISALSGGASYVLDVETFVAQVSRNSLFLGVWFTHLSRMTLVDVSQRKTIAEWDCAVFVRHPRKDFTLLSSYLSEDKAQLKADLLSTGAQCRKAFITQALKLHDNGL